MTSRSSSAAGDRLRRSDEGEAALPSPARCVLVANADPSTFGLLCEWLGAEGYRVIDERAATEEVREPIAAVVVDVPFARHGGLELVQQVAARHPGAPILALSATFFANVKCSGGCAHSLGVAGVLPKPLARDALVDALRKLAPGGS